MNDSVVAIVSAFFVIGITVGIITVFAMSALRTDRQGRRGRPPKYGTAAFDELPPEPSWDDADPDDQPRWPAKVDTPFPERIARQLPEKATPRPGQGPGRWVAPDGRW